MDDEMRSRIKAEAQSVIDNGLFFKKKTVVGSLVDYYAPDAEQGAFDHVDDAIEAYTDGDSFDTFVQKLVSEKKVDDLTTFLDWLATQYGSALSQVPRDEAVIAKWLLKVKQVDTLLRDPSS